MDSGETGINTILVILIVLFLVANIYFRRRKSEKTPLGMVATVLSDVNKNQKLIDNFNFHWKSERFKTGNWQQNQSKLDFLPEELLDTLSYSFDVVEDFNDRIDAAKKYKSDSYMAAIDVDKLRSPLAESKEELTEWLRANIQNPEYYPKRRGLFG